MGRRDCEACEKAIQAVARHERSTENLTRAALDQIDQSAALTRRTPEEDSAVAAAIEDAILNSRSFGGQESR